MTLRLNFTRLTTAVLSCTLLVLGACKDPATNKKERLEKQEPDGVDHEGRPIYKCTGDLCYDADDPSTQENRREFEELGELALGDSEDDLAEFRDKLKREGDGYAACNYQLDEGTGLIEVICPDWPEVSACPGDFYKLSHRQSAFSVNGDPNHRFYCIPEDSDMSQRSCSDNLSCPNGEVCTGTMSAEVNDDGRLIRGLACIPAEVCAQLQEEYNIHDATSCFYPDYTEIEDLTPLQEPDHCDDLASDTCSRGCGCDTFSELSEHLELTAQCEMLSEQNTVGLCSLDTCQNDQDCYMLNGAICAQQASLPKWAETHYAAMTADTEDSLFLTGPFPGFCVSHSACEAWNATHDDQLICGTPGDIP